MAAEWEKSVPLEDLAANAQHLSSADAVNLIKTVLYQLTPNGSLGPLLQTLTGFQTGLLTRLAESLDETRQEAERGGRVDLAEVRATIEGMIQLRNVFSGQRSATTGRGTGAGGGYDVSPMNVLTPPWTQTTSQMAIPDVAGVPGHRALRGGDALLAWSAMHTVDGVAMAANQGNPVATIMWRA